MVETNDLSSPLSRHLEELRTYLLLPFVINAILLIMIISFASKLIIQLLETVNLDINELSAYSPAEYFRTKVYVSLVLSLIFVMPLWLLSIYNFAKPGLTASEKKNMSFAFFTGLVFFVIGSVVGLYFLAPKLLDYMMSESEVVSPNLSVHETIKVIISASLFTGLLLTTPVITLIVNRVVDNKNDIRKYIYTLILFIAIIATPRPSMILNLIFLTAFVIVAEFTIFVERRFNGN
ncbi:twin-arginine translocase subunit TatC [Marine Group III euryarchaeote]|nr:twin-arginine translocase subunit TatC [Marine Group III euryarchaeote]